MKEQTFFPDPAMDRLMKVVFGLAADLHAVRTRCRALEDVLARNGAIAKDAVENWQPSPEAQAANEKELHSSIAALMYACKGGTKENDNA